MREAAFTEFRVPEGVSIRTVDDPKPGPGEVVIDVEACGINHHDLWILKGEWWVTEEMLPFVTGGEIAGKIAAVGEGTEPDVELGDRVMLYGLLTCGNCRYCREGPENLCEAAELYHGGLAEKALVGADYVDQGRLIPLPDGVSSTEAATLSAAYTTTWHAFRRANVTAGDLVFIPGATGAVGVAAIQLLDLLGARSVGTSRSEAKLDRVSDIGLDHAIHGSDPEVLKDAVLEIGQPDVMLNHLGGPYTGLGVSVLRRGGTMVVIGDTAGTVSEINNRELYGSRIDVLGSSAGTQHEVERLVQIVDAGELYPVIDREYPLSETAQAFRDLGNAEMVGNLVVTP